MIPFAFFTGCFPITETIVPDTDISSSSGNWASSVGTKHDANNVLGGAGDSDWVEYDIPNATAVCASEENPENYRIGLAAPSGSPAVGACQGMRVKWRLTDETDLAVGGCTTIRMTLRQVGGFPVEIVLDERSNIGSTITEFTEVLSIAAVNSIDDHSDLAIEIRVEVGLEDGVTKVAPKIRCYAAILEYYER